MIDVLWGIVIGEALLIGAIYIAARWPSGRRSQ